MRTPSAEGRGTQRPTRVERSTRIIGGVDEAGLGPLLGPLTIGWSLFRLPEPGADPWQLLRGTVQRKPSRTAKLVVADSKRVFTRNATGLKRLETTVLSFLSLLREGGRTPRDPLALLFDALPPADGLVDQHPWYGSLPPLPRVHEPGAIELSAAMLRRKLERSGLAILDGGVRVVPAGELNASFRETNNKGTTVWSHCLEVLQRMWELHGDADPDVMVDILGGRIRYARLLRAGFPRANVEILFEGPEHSAYLLTEREEVSADAWLPRRMRIDFRAKGEDHSFCVALASCIAKYARELAMDGFNRYFQGLEPGLAPTAGYTTDGRRWLADAGTAIERAGIGTEVLTRDR